MVVDDGNFLCLCCGDVLLAVLAVDRYEKVRLFVEIGHIFDRDLELIEHDLQIALVDGIPSSVDEPDILAVLREEPLDRIARCERVSIRVIVALNDYVVVI